MRLCLRSRCHGWASASMPLAPASVFRHPGGNSVQKRSIPVPDWVPFSVTGWFQQKHFSLHSGTGVAGCQHSKTFYKDEKGYINPARPHCKRWTEILPAHARSHGGHTRPRVRGWWSPNSDDWRKSLALCLLCGLHLERPGCGKGYTLHVHNVCG
jgi:hypothetical protein